MKYMVSTFFTTKIAKSLHIRSLKMNHIHIASKTNVVFVLNATIFGIWHTKHKKQNFIRCVKCVKFLQHTTVPFQFWHGMDRNGIMI